MDMDTKDPKLKKQEKNRENYLRNLEERRAKARARYHLKKQQHAAFQESNVISLLRAEIPKSVQKSGRRGVTRWRLPVFQWRAIVLGLLIAISTFFLLKENANFLSQSETSLLDAWIKALVGEGMLVALSAIRVQGLQMQLARVLLLVALFAYNSVALVGGVWTKGTHQLTASQIVRKQVFELEKEIAKVESLRADHYAAGRITLSRKYEKDLSVLREKLSFARGEMLKNPDAENVKVNFSAYAFFRLLIMLGNSFLISHFSAYFQRKPASVLRLVPG